MFFFLKHGVEDRGRITESIRQSQSVSWCPQTKRNSTMMQAKLNVKYVGAHFHHYGLCPWIMLGALP